MNSEHAGPVPFVPNRVLRGVVALLGVGALGGAMVVLVSIGSFLLREPQSPAEGHALAHSLPGVLIGGIVWIGGLGLAGVVLLLIAYLDRRRLSAVTLVLTGLVVILLFGGRATDPAISVPLLLVVLGSFTLYEDASNRGPFAFVVGATALLWLVASLRFAVFLIGLSDLEAMIVPYAVTVWVDWLLDAGALGILVGAARYRYVGVLVPRVPVVLAVAILLSYLPSAVWVAASQHVIAGFDPLSWTQVLVATVAAATILKQPRGDFPRSFGRTPR